MCRQSRHYLYRAFGTPKLFIIHYSLLIRKAPPCVPVAFIYTFLLKLQIMLSITSDKRVTRFTQASKFPILETLCGSYYLYFEEIYTAIIYF